MTIKTGGILQNASSQHHWTENEEDEAQIRPRLDQNEPETDQNQPKSVENCGKSVQNEAKRV